jgi:hypothetical protein
MADEFLAPVCQPNGAQLNGQFAIPKPNTNLFPHVSESDNLFW